MLLKKLVIRSIKVALKNLNLKLLLKEYQLVTETWLVDSVNPKIKKKRSLHKLRKSTDLRNSLKNYHKRQQLISSWLWINTNLITLKTSNSRRTRMKTNSMRILSMEMSFKRYLPMKWRSKELPQMTFLCKAHRGKDKE